MILRNEIHYKQAGTKEDKDYDKDKNPVPFLLSKGEIVFKVVIKPSNHQIQRKDEGKTNEGNW
jgi:hypothetical protein